MTATVTDIRPTAAAGVAVVPAHELVRLLRTHLMASDAITSRRDPEDLHIELVAADQRLLAYSGDIYDPGDVYTLTSEGAITAGATWALSLRRLAAAALVVLLDSQDCASEDLLILSTSTDGGDLVVHEEFGSHVATLTVAPASGDLPVLDVRASDPVVELDEAKLVQALTDDRSAVEVEAIAVAGLYDRPQPDYGHLLSADGALVVVPYY